LGLFVVAFVMVLVDVDVGEDVDMISMSERRNAVETKEFHPSFRLFLDHRRSGILILIQDERVMTDSPID
jgi:hypothetical protein